MVSNESRCLESVSKLWRSVTESEGSEVIGGLLARSRVIKLKSMLNIYRILQAVENLQAFSSTEGDGQCQGGVLSRIVEVVW